MARVEHDGVEIAYEIYGHGTPIVLLMGLGLPGLLWRPLAEELVARDFRVVVPDNRGTGHSDAPLPPYTMRQMAGDVARILDDADIDSAIVVGVSLGGMIAQHVALEHPGRVRGLALAATTCGAPTGTFPRLEAIWLLLKMVFASTTVTVEEAQRLFSHPASSERAVDLFARWEETLEELPTPPWAVLGQLLAAALHHTGDRLSEIEVPTRVLTGEDDFLIPPENSDILVERIPDATLRTVPRAGHVFVHMHPEVLLDNLLELREEVYSAHPEHTLRRDRE